MTHPRRPLSLIACSLFFLAVPAIALADDFRGAGTHSSNATLFKADQYLHHIDVLASNEYEGRAPGQPGIEKAADYIASTFEALGVQPAGIDGTYFQPFPLKVHMKNGERTRLSLGTKNTNGRERLKLKKDYMPLPFSEAGRFKGDVVFAGYGIVDDRQGYDEYDGVDVEGKIVLVLRRSPDFADFGARHLMFATKAHRAKEHKAAALLIVNPIGDEDGDKLYEFDANANGVFNLASRNYGIPMMHIRQAVAEEMLRDAGLGGLQAVQDRIEKTQHPISQLLDGVSVRGRADVKAVESIVKNIVGLIPGSGPQADEYIILGAHYDHHGICHQDRPDFDVDKHIYNGADDNASGVAMLMSLAKAYINGPKPNRSIILIAFTAEELGLIGSRYYAEHPTINLNDCIAMFNFDMVGRLRSDRLEIGGLSTGDYESTIRRLAERYDIDIKDGGGGQGPSDHTWFYRAGIPVTFWHTGLHKQYTRPQDDTELINEEGAMRIARLAADVIDEIDARPEPPVFQKDRPRRSNADDEEESRPAPTPKSGVRLGITVESQDGTVVVTKVVDDSVAGRAGIQTNDRILQFGDSKIANVDDLLKAMANVKPGDTREIKIRRNGKELTLAAEFMKPADTIGEFLAQMGETLQCDIRIEKVTVFSQEGSMTTELSTNYVAPNRKFLDIVNELVGILKPKAAYDLSLDLAVTIKVDGSPIRGTYKVRFKDIDKKSCVLDESTSRLHHRLTKAIAGLGTRISSELEMDGTQTFEAEITLDEHGKPTISIKWIVRPGENDKPKSPHKHAEHPGSKPKEPDASPARKGFSDSKEMPSRPPVRIGIMPTHGEQDGEGFAIAGVMEGGPAAKAGMQDNDRILTIGGKKVQDIYSYMDALREYEPGDEIEIVVLRDGKKVPLTVKLIKQKKRNRQSED